MADNNLRRTAGRGAMWQVISGGWQALVRLGASTMLARTLLPSDFGLFGMALLVIELVDYLGGLGMTGGVIAKKEVGEKELNTCFWTMAGVRFILFCIAYVCAPLAALFMKEPRVELVVRVISTTFLISIFGIIGNTILSKKLQFGKISFINAAAILFESSLAVFLAKTTSLGYWALVCPMLASSFLTNLSVFFVAKWYPRFIFDKESFKFQFKFGIHGLGFNIANYLHQNIDYFIVGRFMGTTALGLYEYAYRIPHIILDRFARPVGAVVFPAFATVQDDETLIRGYVQTVKYVTILAFPILGGLAVMAKPLVLTLWSEKWQSIIIPMQILCLSVAIRCIVQPLGAVILCKHRPEIMFKQAVISCTATAVFVCLGAWLWGVVGVATGMLLSTLSYIYVIIIAFKLTKTSPKLLLKTLMPATIVTIISSSAALICYNLLVINYNFMLIIPFAIVAGIISYIYSYYIMFKSDFNDILLTARSIIKL